MGMKNICTFLFLILLSSASTCIYADSLDYTAEPLPFAGALSSREITTLYQDREGMIWVGTTYGVARYDGYETTLFKSDYAAPDRLTDNSVTVITDTERHVYVGTKSGLNVFDKSTWRLAPAAVPDFLQTEIKHLSTDRRGQVWVVTPTRLYRCGGPELHVLQCYGVDGVISVYEDGDGRLWALTWGGGMFRYDAKKDRFIALPPVGAKNIPFVLYEDRSGRYWLGTWGDGLYRFHPEEEGTRMFEPVISDDGIYFDIMQDDNKGHLWMLAFNALKEFACQADGSLVLQPDASQFDPNRMFSKILKDRGGDLWLGAYDAGYRLQFRSQQLQPFPLPAIKRKSGFDTNIDCMFEDREGVLWFSQERNGLTLYNRMTDETELHPCRVNPMLEVNFIVPSARPLSAWISSAFIPIVYRAQRSGMEIVVTDTVRLAQSGSETGHIKGMHEDGNGNLWILTEKRLFVFSRAGKAVGVTRNGICSLAEGPEGRVLLGTVRGEILVADVVSGRMHVQKSWQNALFTGRSLIRHLCADADGDFWAVTALGGIYRLRERESEPEDFTAVCNPKGNPILNLEAEDGLLWLVMPSGVVRYDYRHKRLHTYFSHDRHIPVHTFRNTASCLGRGGSFYAGGHGGFVRILPDGRSSVRAEHALRLTDVRIGGRSVLDGDTTLYAVRDTVVTLPPSASGIVFFFSDFNYAVSDSTGIACCLDGSGTDWSVLPKGTHSVSYDRLSRGTHVLRLCHADAAGQLFGPVVSYKVVRLPAWYETCWAFFLYIMAAVALSAVGARYVLMRYRRQNTAEERTCPVVDDKMLDEITAFVKAHLQDADFNLDSLAAAIGLSKSTMNRRVKAMTGLTPMDYVKRIRIRSACAMLRHTDKNVSEVAYSVGFSDPRYFAKCFKEETGLTPTDYRQRKPEDVSL